jgi:citrate lyase beta subunit
MWKANGKTTTLLLFLDSLSPKTEKLSLEKAMDLSRDRLILELEGSVSFRADRQTDMTKITDAIWDLKISQWWIRRILSPAI